MTVRQVAKARDACQVAPSLSVEDRGTWRARWQVEQWSDPNKLAWAEDRSKSVLRTPTLSEWAWLRRANAHALLGALTAQDRLNAILLRNPDKPLSGDQLRLLVPPDAVVTQEYNLLCNPGIARMLDLLIAAGGQGYTNTYARIGVGNGVGTAAAADTDLSAAAGSANRWYQAMDATYPSRASQTLSFRGTLASADGNFAWNELGIDSGGAGASTSSAVVGGVLLNHKTSIAQGTKAVTQVWTITGTLTVS